jgi:hypothetical protein
MPYVAGVVSALVVAGGAWLFWPRPAPPPPPADATLTLPTPDTPAPADASPTPDSSGAPVPPSDVKVVESSVEEPTASAAPGAGLADLEADLPAAELRRLRGVGGWAGNKLTVTLYNGSSWRVTEIFVLTSRMEGDRFVDSVAPTLMLPAGGERVDGAVKSLLQKVAPDRKRAGVNPADTGPFEVELGPAPVAYRWKIERARGYPPRAGE